MKNYVLLILSLVFMTNLSAQDEAYYPAKKSRYLGIEGIFNCPLMDLNDNNYRHGGGFSFSGFGDLTSNRNPLVLQLGLEGLFGVSSKNRTYSIGAPFSETVYNPTNVAVGLNGLLRLEYRKYAVHPYIDGFVGGRFFQSGYYVNNNDDWTPMQSTTNTKWAYGAGVGAFIPVSNRLDINLRAAYTHTDNMQYIDMNDFIDNDRNAINAPAASEHDMLSLHVGIRYNINRNKNKYEQETRRERRSTRYESDCDCCDHRDRCGERRRSRCQSDCDRYRHRNRRNRGLIIDVLLGNLGGSSTCTPPPTECDTDVYSPRPNYRDNDDTQGTRDNDSGQQFGDNDRDDDTYIPPTNGGGEVCPPAYEEDDPTRPRPEPDVINTKPEYGDKPPGRSGTNPSAEPTIPRKPTPHPEPDVIDTKPEGDDKRTRRSDKDSSSKSSRSLVGSLLDAVQTKSERQKKSKERSSTKSSKRQKSSSRSGRAASNSQTKKSKSVRKPAVSKSAKRNGDKG